MNDFELDEQMKSYLSHKMGMPFEQLVETDAEDIDSHIEKRSGIRMRLANAIGGMISRGSLYIFFHRFWTGEYVDNKLSKIKS